MILGVPKETFPGERRVALTPGVLPSLAKAGHEVLVERGAGEGAFYPDQAFVEKGGRIAVSRAELFASAEVILQVLAYGANDKTGRADLALFRRGQVLVGFLRPLGSPETVHDLAVTGATIYAIELIPRITRAQSMDALSSMATVAGFKAVLLAAEHLPRMFPMLTTAAGTIPPARVLVVGAGVAGLQAIATARRLGAVVSAYDVRPAVKEQVQSLGARFVELPLETTGAEDKAGYARAQDEAFYQRQRELMGHVVAESDVVITTAVVPGRKAPVLVTADMVRGMTPGSVIIDMAAERGGNCELTRMHETIAEHGVTIIGPVNLASSIPYHASQMYARNLTALVLHLTKAGLPEPNLEDEITREALAARGGEVVHPRVLEAMDREARAAPSAAAR